MALRVGRNLLQLAQPFGVRAFADAPVVKKNWSAVTLPKDAVKDIPTTVGGGQAFANDLRGTSGLGLGDGLKSHTV